MYLLHFQLSTVVTSSTSYYISDLIIFLSIIIIGLLLHFRSLLHIQEFFNSFYFKRKKNQYTMIKGGFQSFSVKAPQLWTSSFSINAMYIKSLIRTNISRRAFLILNELIFIINIIFPIYLV